MLGSLIIYLKGMRRMMFQLSGFYYMYRGADFQSMGVGGQDPPTVPLSACEGGSSQQTRCATCATLSHNQQILQSSIWKTRQLGLLPQGFACR